MTSKVSVLQMIFQLGERQHHSRISSSEHESRHSQSIAAWLPWAGTLVWPLMLTVPLFLTTKGSPLFYESVFPSEWYFDSNSRPKLLGLFLGILAVGVGQVLTCVFFYFVKNGYLASSSSLIQVKEAAKYEFIEGVKTHFAQPEGFMLLVTYLSATWIFRLMPSSYYSFEGGIQFRDVFLCLVLQDAIQYAMHWMEHRLSPAFYQSSHKPHHRFTNPRLFDAFNGSLTDTMCMIVVPLFLTAHIIRWCNVWSYMSFGSTYACWLTLIHSEYAFPWDNAFRALGLGTPGDHHVHHRFFKYNYGHLFMWCDRLAGTYKSPREFVPKFFRDQM